MLKTEKFYALEDIFKKIQSTNIKLKPNFEIIGPIKNLKVLQTCPLIIILGEEHTLDEEKESYYLKDLEKIEKISNILQINNLALEGLAKGEENNIKKTILNAEVELIKILDKNRKYNLLGIEDLDIQIKILKYGFLVYYTQYLQLINNAFSNLLSDKDFYPEIKIMFETIFNKIIKDLKGNSFNFKTSMKLYLAMQQTGINYPEVFKKFEICYINMLLHLNGLRIYPKDHNEFHYIASKIAKESEFNLIRDYKKIEQIHFDYISTVRDEIFTRNILDQINEKKISSLIVFCGTGHLKNIGNLIYKDSEKKLGTKVNVILMDIS